MKKSVRKRIPVFSVNCATVPHCEQRIISPVLPAPQVKNFVPMIKNIFISNCRFRIFQTVYNIFPLFLSRILRAISSADSLRSAQIPNASFSSILSKSYGKSKVIVSYFFFGLLTSRRISSTISALLTLTLKLMFCDTSITSCLNYKFSFRRYFSTKVCE